jgi:hypothetical protein
MTVVSIPRFRRMYATAPGFFTVGVKQSKDGRLLEGRYACTRVLVKGMLYSLDHLQNVGLL